MNFLALLAHQVWTILQAPETLSVRIDLLEHMIATSEPSTRAWIFYMMEVLSHEELTKMTVTLWAIWYARRKLIHEGINQSPYVTHNFVDNFIAELEQPTPLSKTQETGGKGAS